MGGNEDRRGSSRREYPVERRRDVVGHREAEGRHVKAVQERMFLEDIRGCRRRHHREGKGREEEREGMLGAGAVINEYTLILILGNAILGP